MRQSSFSDFENARELKRRVPCQDASYCALERLTEADRTVLPKADGGRKPYPLETVLRIPLAQNLFSQSDLASPAGQMYSFLAAS